MGLGLSYESRGGASNHLQCRSVVTLHSKDCATDPPPSCSVRNHRANTHALTHLHPHTLTHKYTHKHSHKSGVVIVGTDRTLPSEYPEVRVHIPEGQTRPSKMSFLVGDEWSPFDSYFPLLSALEITESTRPSCSSVSFSAENP